CRRPATRSSCGREVSDSVAALVAPDRWGCDQRGGGNGWNRRILGIGEDPLRGEAGSGDRSGFRRGSRTRSRVSVSTIGGKRNQIRYADKRDAVAGAYPRDRQGRFGLF